MNKKSCGLITQNELGDALTSNLEVQNVFIAWGIIVEVDGIRTERLSQVSGLRTIECSLLWLICVFLKLQLISIRTICKI